VHRAGGPDQGRGGAAIERMTTSHLIGRKTVASRFDATGQSTRVAADQLGHTRPSMTQDTFEPGTRPLRLMDGKTCVSNHNSAPVGTCRCGARP
jgi:hypothetical protein